MKPTKTAEEFEKDIVDLFQRISQIKDTNNVYTPIQDGIISLSDYLVSKYRIMWVLKDANSIGDSDWDQVDTIKRFSENGLDHAWKKTFQHIAYITFGILNNLKWENIPDIDDKNSPVSKILKSIAFINVKKIPGGNTSKDNELWEYSERYKDLLVDQIEKFEPNIVIFGNTLRYLLPHLNLSEDVETYNNINFTSSNGKLLINICHPNYISRGGVNAKDYYTSIKQICDNYFKV